MKHLLYIFMTLTLTNNSIAMHIKQSQSVVIVGGDVAIEAFESIFEDINLPTASFEFLAQSIDRTLPTIDTKPNLYILYIIDNVKFEKHQEAYTETAGILGETRKKFPKSSLPIFVLMTNLQDSANSEATRNISEYFSKVGIELYLNNLHSLSTSLEAMTQLTEEDLARLKMLKTSMHVWSLSST